MLSGKTSTLSLAFRETDAVSSCHALRSLSCSDCNYSRCSSAYRLEATEWYKRLSSAKGMMDCSELRNISSGITIEGRPKHTCTRNHMSSKNGTAPISITTNVRSSKNKEHSRICHLLKCGTSENYQTVSSR